MSKAPAPEWKDKPEEGRWIMTSKRTVDPFWCLTFFIGNLPIAKIFFDHKKPYLKILDKIEGPFASVGNTMRRMHQLLKMPPED